MSDAVFDTAQLDQWAKDMLQIAETKLPKEAKKFLRKEGNQLRKETIKEAKNKVRADHKKPERYKSAVHYHKSIKRGRVYRYRGDLSIRAYSMAPHAHLLEYGHRLLSHGKEVGVVPGVAVFETARKRFEQTFVDDCEHWIDEVMDKL